jgi:hypothetical protein
MSNQTQPEHPELNTAFVLRLLWDSVAQSWRVVLKPADGGPKRIFVDLESAFLYVAQLYSA